MRPIHLLLLMISLFFFAATASAESVTMFHNDSIMLENCASGGSSEVLVPEGYYIFKTFDADTWVCINRTSCATGGQRYPANTIMAVKVTRKEGIRVRCRSASSTGDVHFGRTN